MGNAADRRRWNARHRRRSGPPQRPSACVRCFHRLAAPPGPVLDIAAGSGRNSLFLARRGFTVEAVDISLEGLRRITPRPARLHPVCQDLGTFAIAPQRYGLIVNVRFLDRRLFPQIIEGLAPGGLLIFQTLLDTPGDPRQDGFCRDYLLRPNELLHAFLALRVIYYREGPVRATGGPSRQATLVAAKRCRSLGREGAARSSMANHE